MTDSLVNCPDCRGKGELQIKCSCCGGTGREECGECFGKGSVPDFNIHSDREWRTCPRCKGSGVENHCLCCASRGFDLEACDTCGGLGKLPATVGFKIVEENRRRKAEEEAKAEAARTESAKKQADEENRRRKAEEEAKAEAARTESVKKQADEERARQLAADMREREAPGRTRREAEQEEAKVWQEIELANKQARQISLNNWNSFGTNFVVGLTSAVALFLLLHPSWIIIFVGTGLVLICWRRLGLLFYGR